MAPTRIRKYPHFDGDLTPAEADALTCDAKAVSRHAFFPFIESAEHWTKFSIKGIAGVSKDRPIRYAARKDACIYSHYREILVPLYEAKLKSLGIDKSVLAYRRIPKDGGIGNKSNIDFAKDVVCEIAQKGNCYAYALDIKGFFDNIDHDKLKKVWQHVLGEQKLPKDHFKVFTSITKSAWVNKEAVYKLLGYIGQRQTRHGTTTTGYLVKRVPLQICDAKTFRQKVTKLIKKNDDSHGIPQGSPISDVLANMYLLDFDAKMVTALAVCGGKYYRYSDDILIVVPGKNENIQERLQSVQDTLNSCGDKLVIQTKKTSVHKFEPTVQGAGQSCKLILGTQGKNGLEYLGFRFNGKHVYIRDNTRTALNRKVTIAARRLARLHANANPQMSTSELKASFNYDRVIKKFGRVDDFELNALGYKGWTFWTYAKRAHAIFGAKGKPILRQLRSYKDFIRLKSNEALSQYSIVP